MKFLETLRKSQNRYKKLIKSGQLKLPKWEDCEHMTPEQFDRLWGIAEKLPCAPQVLTPPSNE